MIISDRKNADKYKKTSHKTQELEDRKHSTSIIQRKNIRNNSMQREAAGEHLDLFVT